MAGIRRPSPSPLRRDDGFTIIEVMVAAAILLVGIMGVLGILVQADATSTSNKAREQGVALEREILEDAHSIPYDQLQQNTIVATLQGQAGLSDSTNGSSGWTIRRRNITYTIAVGTCSVDDSKDGTGPHESAGYCIDGTGSTTPAQCLSYLGRAGSIQGNGAAPSAAAAGDCGIDSNLDGAVDGLADTSGGPCTNCAGTDANPNDYKRIVVLVRWDKGLGTRYALQDATVPNPGLSAAPAITALTPVSTTVLPGTPQPLSFNVTTSFKPATVDWYVDGTQKGLATGSLTNWNVTWNLGTVSAGSTPNSGEVLDGTYLLSVKAFDAYGQAGTTKAATVIVNRRAPYPPSNLRVGRNNNNAYIEWGANAERDVEGYRVYRVVSSGTDADVCGFVSGQTRCQENGMPAGSQQYYVRAVDRDTAGVQRLGDKSAVVTVPAAGVDTPPTAPVTITAAKSGQNTVLSWSASSDVDPGDSIQYYRIYRDGTSFISDYYARTASGANLSFTDNATNGDVHTYFIVAVDQSNVESAMGSGVTK